MKHKEKALPLSWIVLTALLLNTALIVLLTTNLLVNRFNVSMVQTTTQNTEQTAQNIARSVDAFVEEKLAVLELARLTVDNVIAGESLHEDLGNMVQMNSDIVSLGIYDAIGNLRDYVTSQPSDLKANYQEIDQSFDRWDFEASGDYYVSAPHINNLFSQSYPWVVTFMVRCHGPCGDLRYVVMDIAFGKISRYVDKITIGDRGYVFIADGDGNLIYHPQQQLIYSQLKEENTEILPQLVGGDTFDDGKNIYSAAPVSQANWNIVAVSNMEEMITNRQQEAIQYTMVVALVALAMSVVLGLILLRGLTRPIARLIRSIKAFETDVDNYQKNPNHGFQEIRQLSDSFDQMAERIQRLMERVVREEHELRKVEMKALQAQINPHFLYNTLDSIFWMCKEKGNEDAANMVAALANTFRISISRGKDEITVRQEIKHVESYLLIQNIRYKNQFTYDFQVEEDILDCKCLKILLQPFVENAIYHGLNRMIDDGEIHIRAFSVGEEIHFQVADNGVGMTLEQVTRLFTQAADDDNRVGVGVKNVHNRVMIFYGEEYGVSLESELDEGTTVTIRIPKVEGGTAE